MNPKTSFVDYYETLGVWPTADADSVKKAYFKLAKLHHPDIAGKTPVDGGVDFKLINEAFHTLSDPSRRREYDDKLKKHKGGGGEVPPERREADKRSAQLAFEQARTAMKSNRYDKAVVLLKSAIGYDDSNAAYHSYYGYALGTLKTHLHQARDACKKALEMEFYNADYHANLGFVYYQAGLSSTADESFAEALKWDPEHALALKHYGGPGGGKKAGGAGGPLAGILKFFSGGDSDKKPEKKGKSKGKVRR